jgi:hypothetical protein
MRSVPASRGGFSTLELLVVLALGAVVLSGVMVTYGTLMAGRTNINETVEVVMPAARAANFFGPGAPGVRTIPVAPNYGALARAEKLREEFNRDALGAASIFCLYRRPSVVSNTLRFNWFPYNAMTDGQIDSPRAFYDFLVRKYPVAATVFEAPANPGAAAPPSKVPDAHATIFMTSFTAEPDKVAILATYEVDVIRYEGLRPWGFYASVRKYSFNAANVTALESAFVSGFEVFFQPSMRVVTSPTQFSTEGFNPLFIMFDRAVRRSVVEDSVLGRDRFKVAGEQPFYFIWWPDPAMTDLASMPLSGQPREARRAYNHMGGRTSFMFTVPIFPAL